MYQEKMAFAIKANGKVLREFGETVYIPFGSEYSILIKNLNSIRALVEVWIDGVCITEGVKLIVNGNQSLDLERFIKNGNMNAGNKLKFIEKTQQISDYRGNRVDDGLVRITYEFEKVNPYKFQPFDQYVNPWEAKFQKSRSPYETQQFYGSTEGPITKGGLMHGGNPLARSININSNSELAVANAASTISDAGITVEGSVSDQKFSYAARFETDGVERSMVIVLKGETDQALVKSPVTVEQKPVCKTCGKTNRAGSKFCSECGTSLQII